MALVTQAYDGQFVSELAHLFKAFATASALEGVALKAAMVFTTLSLQKRLKQKFTLTAPKVD